MISRDDRIEAVVFDFGNTLINFGHKQIRECDRRLAEALTEMYGPPDLEKMDEIRKRDRLAPYSGDPPEYRENVSAEISENIIRELYNRAPTKQELNRVLKVKFDSFVSVVEVPDYIHDLLDDLQQRYRLALLSNYPNSHAICECLKRLKLDRFFETVVVSGDIGFVKPHALPFQVLIREMQLRPDEIVYVGDNWLADVQGPKKMGMRAVYSRQWVNPEGFAPRADDVPADETIDHLTDILEIL